MDITSIVKSLISKGRMSNEDIAREAQRDAESNIPETIGHKRIIDAEVDDADPWDSAGNPEHAHLAAGLADAQARAAEHRDDRRAAECTITTRPPWLHIMYAAVLLIVEIEIGLQFFQHLGAGSFLRCFLALALSGVLFALVAVSLTTPVADPSADLTFWQIVLRALVRSLAMLVTLVLVGAIGLVRASALWQRSEPPLVRLAIAAVLVISTAGVAVLFHRAIGSIRRAIAERRERNRVARELCNARSGVHAYERKIEHIKRKGKQRERRVAQITRVYCAAYEHVGAVNNNNPFSRTRTTSIACTEDDHDA